MMNSDLDKLRDKSVFIFGAGLAGSSALENLEESVRVKGFIDNDTAKIGEEILGYTVFSPEHLRTAVFDFVLIASEYFEQISNQLVARFAISRESIVILPARMLKSVSLGQSADTQCNALRVLFTVTQCLNENAVNYYVDAGTLLGIFRDGRLIPWDDDLDLAVNADDLDELKKAMNVAMMQLSQEFQCQWKLTEHISTKRYKAVPEGAIRSFKLQPVNSEIELPMMDFFVKYIDGDRMDYSLASRGISMPASHLLNTVEYEFKQQTIRFPQSVEEYLTSHYGDWQTPVRDWNLSMLKNATVY